MELKHKKLWVFNLAAAVLLFFSTDAYAEAKVGWLIDITATDHITIDEALGFPEKKHMTYIIADDAKWHICTKKACILKKGVGGYPAFKELVKKEAYGIPYETFRVLLNFKGGKVAALMIQISKKMH
ncbi:MAG: hypothetical protein IMF07_09450 [Proteobacteria bacterium]|nr:hypothetical protein [Pseudomonadota bacterium]